VDQRPGILYSVSGNIPTGLRYLRPGSDPLSNDEISLRFNRRLIAIAMSVNVRIPPGAGKTDTWTLRKNGVDTPLSVSLSDSETNVTFSSESVDFSPTDLYSMKMEADAGTDTEDPVVTVEI